MRPITISLTRYKEPDSLLRECLTGISKQKNIQAKVLVLDQRDGPAIQKFCESLSSNTIKFYYHVIDEVSLSYARNKAIEFSHTDVLLFIEPDAVAKSNWAFELGSVLQNGASVAGGRIIPRWHKKPLWVFRSSIIREQYSVFDLGNKTFPTDRVLGTNFGISLELLGEQAFFDERLGRKEGKLLSGEETDLCYRTRKENGHVVYCGASTVIHQIPSHRINYGWIWRRLKYAGRDRAIRGGIMSPIHKLSIWDCIVAPYIAIPYLFGYTHQKFIKKQSQ